MENNDSAGLGENNFITLHQATKFCNYSQDYLNLRARQKKLRAGKIGRNWVTTREWLDEYGRQVEQWNAIVQEKKQNSGVPKPSKNEIDLDIDLKIIEGQNHGGLAGGGIKLASNGQL